MRKSLMMAALASAAFIVLPADAQTASVDARLQQLEKRMNTVERVVARTSGGMVQPEIGPTPTPSNPIGTPAGSPLVDLQARVASLENELAGFTGRLETDEHRLQQLEGDFAAYRKATDARIKALEDRLGPQGAGPGDGGGDLPVVKPTKPPVAGGTKPPVVAADPDRAARVAAVVKPTGKDAVDKAMYAYNYGYRFWQAKLYPEAEAQLQGFAGKFPGHRLTSRAQNLLGMIYMDDGKPNLAAQIFYDNYSKVPDGERAAESLLNLAKALTVLKKPRTDICRVYGELNDVYGTKLTAAQKGDLDKGRAANKCA